MFGTSFPALGQPLFKIIEAPTPPPGYPVVQSLEIAGISGDGNTVVGCVSYATTTPQPPLTQLLAFKWTLAGGSQTLSDLPGGAVNSCAYGASMDGSVIVGEGTSYPETREAVRWINGTIEGLGDIQGGLPASSAADTTNGGNTIVGQGFHQAFKWDNGVMVGLGNLPDGHDSAATGVSADGTVIVGTGWNSQGNQGAFRWTTGELHPLSNLPTETIVSSGTDISADGEVIVGWTIAPNNLIRAFRWTNGVVLQIGGVSQAYGISGDGSAIVGQSSGMAVVWDATHGARDLNEVLEGDLGLFLGTWNLSVATAVSFDGMTIAGSARRATDNLIRGFVTRLGYSNTTDSDGDGIPDSLDVCVATIPDVSVDSAGCTPQFPLDLDRDGDADLADLAIMQRCWTGPDIPIAPACLSAE